MPTVALVGGMLPLWVGTGPGSEERRAIAVVVIGGQTLSLLLTLLGTPAAPLPLAPPPRPPPARGPWPGPPPPAPTESSRAMEMASGPRPLRASWTPAR